MLNTLFSRDIFLYYLCLANLTRPLLLDKGNILYN